MARIPIPSAAGKFLDQVSGLILPEWYEKLQRLFSNFYDAQANSVTVITATDTAWPVPAGITELIIEAWGGGAAGAFQSGGTQRGGGGGAGAYVYKRYTGIMDATLSITIGAGGVSAAGGNTIVVGTNLGTLTAAGGSRGSAGAVGGAGGVASGGDININGEAGYCASTGVNGIGYGGSAPRGGAGHKLNVDGAGSAPGGGGSGENHIGGAGGGNGAQGWVIIYTR